MQKKPKISVIIPVYNVEKYLERCIESVINQTYNNIEIILIDDGSADKSGKICDYFSKIDSRIKVIHKKNGGLSDARNVGLQTASGDYIAFVDGDDWIEKDMYECLYNLICEYQADISMCAANSVDFDGKIVDSGKFPDKGKNYENITVYMGDEIIKAHLSKTNDINAGVWNKLYRRNIINGIEFPKSKLYEDVFVMYKYLNRASKVVKTRSHKYNYFQREDSICRKKFSQKNFDSVEANKERYLFIKKNYPELEPLARRQVLINLLNIGFRLAESNQLIEFRPELFGAIKDTKKLSIIKCDLNFKQKCGIFLMRNNLGLFQYMTKIMYS